MRGVFIPFDFCLWAFWASGGSRGDMGPCGLPGGFGALLGYRAIGLYSYSTIAPLDGRMGIKWPVEPSKSGLAGSYKGRK